MSAIFSRLPTSIFEHMSGLAAAHQAVNLGQGFPDFGWSDAVVGEAARSLCEDSNQYPPMRGLRELREAVARHYRDRQGLPVESGQVIITSGATEALASSLLALVSPGDEVLLFQPLYDAYVPIVLRSGGLPRFVSLEPPRWRITAEALAAAITDRTRVIVLNHPHNPTARLLDADELRIVAEACVEHDLVAVSDEVWEHVVFDGGRFVSLAALPGMAERTVKIGSAGKIFSLTGWKVGWVIAPPALADTIARAHQFVTFTTAPNLQRAVAFGLSRPMAEVDETSSAFAASRDRLRIGLEAEGFVTLAAEATYFMTVDLAASGIDADDVTFCERAVREAQVAAIPISALYAEDPVRNVIRLCFAKRAETLDAGIEGLARAKALMA